MAQTLQTAWAYIWAGMNTGIHMRVHMHVRVHELTRATILGTQCSNFIHFTDKRVGLAQNLKNACLVNRGLRKD